MISRMVAVWASWRRLAFSKFNSRMVVGLRSVGITSAFRVIDACEFHLKQAQPLSGKGSVLQIVQGLYGLPVGQIDRALSIGKSVDDDGLHLPIRKRGNVDRIDGHLVEDFEESEFVDENGEFEINGTTYNAAALSYCGSDIYLTDEDQCRQANPLGIAASANRRR